MESIDGHKLSVVNRETAVITGVKEVVSFDANEVELETIQGSLTIHGETLHVSRLTLEKGEVDIDGKIESFIYSDSTQKTAGSLIGRLFR